MSKIQRPRVTTKEGTSPWIHGQEETEVGVGGHTLEAAIHIAPLRQEELAIRLQQGIQPVQDSGVAQIGSVD